MAPPAADVYETDGDYVFELEVPGFEEKQLTVKVSDHTLTVRGERAETTEEKGKTFHLPRRLSTQFERRFELPRMRSPTRCSPTSRRASSRCMRRRRRRRSRARWRSPPSEH